MDSMGSQIRYLGVDGVLEIKKIDGKNEVPITVPKNVKFVQGTICMYPGEFKVLKLNNIGTKELEIQIKENDPKTGTIGVSAENFQLPGNSSTEIKFSAEANASTSAFNIIVGEKEPTQKICALCVSVPKPSANATPPTASSSSGNPPAILQGPTHLVQANVSPNTPYTVVGSPITVKTIVAPGPSTAKPSGDIQATDPIVACKAVAQVNRVSRKRAHADNDGASPAGHVSKKKGASSAAELNISASVQPTASIQHDPTYSKLAPAKEDLTHLLHEQCEGCDETKFMCKCPLKQ